MINSITAGAARRVCAAAAAVAMSLGLLSAGGCRSVEQQSFDSPDLAVDALVAAIRPEVDTTKLKEVFGPDAAEAMPSGDTVADRAAVAEFLERYDRGHRIVEGADGARILEIDSDHWPFAFPLVKTDDGWIFDTIAGLEELDNRRVGSNELDTIQTCLAIVDAQREYAMLDIDRDGVREYALKFLSDSGKRNGLFWATKEGEAASPLGDLIGRAAEEGYERGAGVYHGYRFKMLTGQGPGASGGESDYLVRGRLVGGFGVLAWPAEYGRSGIKSFITSHEGVIYEMDLGDETERVASGMKRFDPAGWTAVAQ